MEQDPIQISTDTSLKNTVAKERGNRLRYLRKGLRLSMKTLEDLGIPRHTVYNWEEARFGGLSEKGANRLIEIFRQEGIQCSVEWLLYGLGTDPLSLKLAAHNEEAAIAEELKLFHQLHPNAVDAIVTDDSLLPLLQPGDLVAGQRYFAPEIDKALNHLCIIHLPAGTVHIGLLKKGTQPNLYNLLQNNKEILKELALFSAAPIIWFRKKL